MSPTIFMKPVSVRTVKAPPTKPEEEELVSVEVIVEDEAIEIANVILYPITERTAAVLIEAAASSDTVVIVSNLIDPARVSR